MSELQEIIKAFDSATALGESCVLATVVHLEGSSYRRPGARMLVLQSGKMIGAISGGCLEGDAFTKAMLTFSDQVSRLVTYDTSDEDDAIVGAQLGCEGIIRILFEFIHVSQPCNPIEILRKTLATRQPSVLAIVFDLQNKRSAPIGTCGAHLQNEEYSIDNLDIAFSSELKGHVQQVFHQKKSLFIQIQWQGQILTAFLEWQEPPVSLVIVGAGNDAIPLMQMASILGWEVKIVDGRKTHAKTERFSNACQILVSRPTEVLEQISWDDKTCFVLMTHNYRYDFQILKALLSKHIPYIGLLGPLKKWNRMMEDLEADGVVLTSAMLSKIYAPTGLDLGADTPAEIASSIIAEIQAVMNNKEPRMLKWKKDLIHS